MTFKDYVLENGVPDRVICVDKIIRHYEVSRDHFYVPLVTGMVVDHIQIDLENGRGRIVFLRCPDGVNAV